MTAAFKDDQRKFLEGYAKAGPYLGLGVQMAATVILMFFIGKFIDDWLNTRPLFILIFSLFGSFAALYNFIRSVLKLSGKKKSNDKN